MRYKTYCALDARRASARRTMALLLAAGSVVGSRQCLFASSTAASVLRLSTTWNASCHETRLLPRSRPSPTNLVLLYYVAEHVLGLPGWFRGSIWNRSRRVSSISSSPAIARIVMRKHWPPERMPLSWIWKPFPPNDKPSARAALAAAGSRRNARTGTVNGAESQWFREDLPAVRGAGVAGVLLPKAENVADIRRNPPALRRGGADFGADRDGARILEIARARAGAQSAAVRLAGRLQLDLVDAGEGEEEDAVCVRGSFRLPRASGGHRAAGRRRHHGPR